MIEYGQESFEINFIWKNIWEPLKKIRKVAVQNHVGLATPLFISSDISLKSVSVVGIHAALVSASPSPPRRWRDGARHARGLASAGATEVRAK